MHCYAVNPSILAGSPGGFMIAVEPNKIFGIEFLQQAPDGRMESAVWDNMTPLSFDRVVAQAGVVNGVLFQYYVSGQSDPVTPDANWNWPCICFPCPEVGNANVFAAVVYEMDPQTGMPTDATGKALVGQTFLPMISPYVDSMGLFVVRRSGAVPLRSIAYILPIATYQAYNIQGGGGFYEYCIGGQYTSMMRSVTFLRPGGGLGGMFGEPDDPYDLTSARPTYPHFDAKFITWLRGQGFTVDVYADLDLDSGAFLFDGQSPRYNLVVMGGHFEYWSVNMRNNISTYLQRFGNVACFSGNTCFRRITVTPRGTIDKPPVQESDRWDDTPQGNESDLIGLSYKAGGGWWGKFFGGNACRGWTDTERDGVGFTVAEGMSHEWAFYGTGLIDGQTFGGLDHLVGYECDGPVACNPLGGKGCTPPQWITLATAAVPSNWDMAGSGKNQAAIGYYSAVGQPGFGVFFNAGTTDWARVCTDPNAVSGGIVQRITLNVINYLSASDRVRASRPAVMPASAKDPGDPRAAR